MLLHIIARGRIGRGPEADLVERYLKRIAWPTKISELPDSGGRVPPAADNSVTILLDEKGEQLGSVDFARRLERWRDQGKRELVILLKPTVIQSDRESEEDLRQMRQRYEALTPPAGRR